MHIVSILCILSREASPGQVEEILGCQEKQGIAKGKGTVMHSEPFVNLEDNKLDDDAFSDDDDGAANSRILTRASCRNQTWQLLIR